MFKQITLKNILSHRHTVLDLAPGVNAIIGQSGKGKSNIFKGLIWLFSNRPLGDDIVSWAKDGETLGPSSVEVVTMDGIKIGRVKGGKENHYYLDQKQFKAPGNGPPPQAILDALNLSEVNVQAQTAPAFLVNAGGGHIAQYLNKIANLEIISDSLANVGTSIRSAKGALDAIDATITNLQADIDNYAWVDNANDKLAALEKKSNYINYLSGKWATLADNLKKHNQQVAMMQPFVDLPARQRLLVRMATMATSTKQLERQRVQLARYVENRKELQQKMGRIKPIADLLPCVSKWQTHAKQIVEREKLWEAIAAQLDSYDAAMLDSQASKLLLATQPTLQILYDKATYIMKRRHDAQTIQTLIAQKAQAQRTLLDAQTTLFETKKEMGRIMPAMCPLCQQPIKQNVGQP